MNATSTNPSGGAGRGPDSNAPPDPEPHHAGATTPVKDGDLAHKQPHERDESSDSQHSEPRDVMRQARDDIENGLRDTSRGEATDPTYERELRGEPQPARPGADAPKNRR